MVNFNYFLKQKYQLLRQQADAQTQNANTNQTAAQAAARLDNVRATLLPDESAANIAQTRAQASLLGEQAKVVAPESRARIANTNADTRAIGIGADIAKRRGLTILPTEAIGDAARRIAGGGGVFEEESELDRLTKLPPPGLYR